MSERITSLLAGEFPASQTPLRAILSADERFLVVGEVVTVAGLLAVAERLKPQIIIVDWALRNGNLLNALVTLIYRNPTARILVLAEQATDLSFFATIRAGALGYLLMDEGEEEIARAIAAVTRGEFVLSPRIAATFIHKLKPPVQPPPKTESLTDTEMEILALVARGFSNLEISQTLEIDERTVRILISSILSKLHLANRSQIPLWMLAEGTFEVDKLSQHLQRVQEFCRQLRGTLQGTLDGEPAFFVGGKAYAVYLEVAHPNRPFALLLPMPYGTQDTVLKQSPHKFFPAPRYADQGWIGIDLTQMKGEELRYYLYQAWKLVAP